MTFPVLLDDLPAPFLGAYPKPTVIAEKLEAIVRLDRVNARLKDCFACGFCSSPSMPILLMRLPRFWRRSRGGTRQSPRPRHHD